MSDIEIRLNELLANSEQVNISSLGGIERVLSGFDSITQSRLADEFLLAIVSDENNVNLPKDRCIVALYNQTLECNTDPLVIRNVALQVCGYASTLKGCFDTLLGLLSSERSSFVRGQFLLAAFAIAVLDKPKQYKLISFLVEKREEDEAFIQYQVKITGLSYSYFDNEDLLSMLEQFDSSLTQLDELHFELGMAYLKKALGAGDKKIVQSNLSIAMSYFSSAEEFGRVDAGCYRQLLSIATQFSLSEGQEGLRKRIEELNTHLKSYSAYHSYRHELGWANLRQQELMNWYLLSGKLTDLSIHLGPHGWLNPVLIIEEYLLQIYNVQRSMLMHGNDGGLNLLIRPEIVKRMSPLDEKVSLLEQWLSSAIGHTSIPIAKQLIAEVEIYKAGLLSGNELGTAFNKLEDVVPAINSIPADGHNSFVEYVKQRITQENLRKDKILEAIFCTVMDTLSNAGLNKDNEIWFAFQQIVYYSLFFLKDRMDGTVKNFPRLKYLFDGDSVLEAAVQDDYYQNMLPLIVNCNVNTEQMDIGGGRADVFFRFPDFFIVTEVKREKRKRTMDQLAKAYVSQTKEYQNTSAKLGILLVMDLAPKKGGIGSIESHVKPIVINVDENGQKRGVVLFRLPGNRIKPSEMKA